MTTESPQLFDLGIMDSLESNMLTRRSTRSFVEDELDADLRELLRAPSAGSAAPSTETQPIQIPADGRHPSLSVHTSMDTNTAVSSGASSSRASTVSSSYTSSTLSTPDIGAAVTNLNLLNEDSFQQAEADDIPIVAPDAPINFGFVMPGLFRSSYPKPENFDFLKQLGLKSIVTLVDKNYTDDYRDFITDNSIEHHLFAMKGTKKEDIPVATMEAILRLVLDDRNYPMLIHCNQGRHRTGCVVAIMREIAGWDRNAVTDEYRAYAGRKVRDCDIDYIRAFNLSSIEKLLARDDLRIDQLIINSRVGGPMVGQPPPSTVGFRVPNFFRTTFFSMTVLFIWIVSGSKMPPSVADR